MTDPTTAAGTFRPASIAALQDWLRDPAGPAAVYPRGGGTWQTLGNIPAKPGATVETTALDRVVDYPHEDLTITAEAGIRVAELQRVLAEKGQTFPIDCPFPAEATLGGLLATNTSGPRRLGHGTARDYVLGLDVVDAAGKRLHGGGRVVKNVAGYDLPKLHLGALGTLGIIVEATLKVKPLPEATEMVSASLAEENLAECLASIRGSPLRPVAIVVVDCGGRECRVTMAFEDVREAVEEQAGAARALLGRHGTLTNASPVLDALPFPATAGETHAKACVRPSDFARLWHETSRSSASGDRVGYPGNGILWRRTVAHMEYAEQLDFLRHCAELLGGHLIACNVPAGLVHELPPWGTPRPDWALMDRIRVALDPRRRINPGRFVVE